MAALGMAHGRGDGEITPRGAGGLWTKELAEEEEDIELEKVTGTQNIADAFTKHLAQTSMERHLQRMSFELREGRAESGLQMQQDASE